MTDSEFKNELFQLGLSEKEFSIKLSNQYAYYHLRQRVGCYEVFYQDEKGGVSDKREYDNEEIAKKALIDLVRMDKGLKAKYYTIDCEEKLLIEKERILSLIRNSQKNKDKIHCKLYDLTFSVDFNSSKSIEILSDYLIDFGIGIDRYIFEEVFYFVESILIKPCP